jgi:flagellar hook protein FlgE
VDGNVIDEFGNPVTMPMTNDPPFGSFLQLQFDTNGLPSGPTTSANITIPGINGAAPLTMNVDYGTSTQFGAKFGVNGHDQDGYSSGRLMGFSVDSTGVLLGSYSNGKTRNLGQVVLTHFANPNGLTPLGDNEWCETLESGAPLTGEPMSSNLGYLRSYYVEESNVDLTKELVNMITAQRVYQANAQTIKTEDQIMQTIVNLR